MSNDENQVRVKHFGALKFKYQATKYEDSSPSSLLYLILRKADLGIELTEFELNWLEERELSQTIDLIWLERHKAEEAQRLENEFLELKSKYKVPIGENSSLSNVLYPLLWKLNSEHRLSDAEIQLLKDNNLGETVAIAEEMGNFKAIKDKYNANKYQDSSPESPLYQILKQLDAEKQLSDSDLNWLNERELFETLEVFQKQESAREAEFAHLKEKYKATKHTDISVRSQLYPILQNLECGQLLSKEEINWLKQQELTETVIFAEELEQRQEFANLKVKYQATLYEDASPSSRLYAILKSIESGNLLNNADLKWLTKKELTDTISLAIDKLASMLHSKIGKEEELEQSEIYWLKNNGREDVIRYAEEKHFVALKIKYRILDPRNKLPFDPFYTIMLKLERGERLDTLLVVRLMEEKLLARHGKIAVAYYKLEAQFHSQEFHRTKDQYLIPRASSFWRKADEPWRALELTNNLNISLIKDKALKSRILVSRGAAFRDIHRLDESEECAREAIDCQPDSHQPYTLLGAICFDRGEYAEGNDWFEQAINLGAKNKDIDDEIESVVRNARDKKKQQEAAEYLLQKDPVRFAWANSYMKN